jgi:hypothetical protein
VSEEGDDELQALLQNFSTGGDSADAYEQQQQQPSQVRAGSLECAFAAACPFSVPCVLQLVALQHVHPAAAEWLLCV